MPYPSYADVLSYKFYNGLQVLADRNLVVLDESQPVKWNARIDSLTKEFLCGLLTQWRFAKTGVEQVTLEEIAKHLLVWKNNEQKFELVTTANVGRREDGATRIQPTDVVQYAQLCGMKQTRAGGDGVRQYLDEFADAAEALAGKRDDAEVLKHLGWTQQLVGALKDIGSRRSKMSLEMRRKKVSSSGAHYFRDLTATLEGKWPGVYVAGDLPSLLDHLQSQDLYCLVSEMDGGRNYRRGDNNWCVAATLFRWVDHSPDLVCGAIFHPSSNELLLATGPGERPLIVNLDSRVPRLADLQPPADERPFIGTHISTDVRHEDEARVLLRMMEKRLATTERFLSNGCGSRIFMDLFTSSIQACVMTWTRAELVFTARCLFDAFKGASGPTFSDGYGRPLDENPAEVPNSLVVSQDQRLHAEILKGLDAARRELGLSA